MRSLLFTLVFISSLLAAPTIVKEENLYKIYGVNLERFLKTNPLTLVVIHDDSDFSTQVLNTLNSLEPMFQTKGLGLKIAKMLNTTGPRWVYTWHAHHQPFLRLFLGDGAYTDLQYYPSYKNINDWVMKALRGQSEIKLIDSDAKRDEFNKESFAFYMRFPEDQPHFLSYLQKLRKIEPELKVYYTHNRILDAFDIYRPKDIVVGFRRTFDDGVKVMSSERKMTIDTVHKFFDVYRAPDVTDLNEKVANEILTLKRRAIVFFGNETKSDSFKEFRAAAFHNKDRLLFVHADLNTEIGKNLAEIARVESLEETIRIIDYNVDKFRIFNVADFSSEEISNHVRNYEQGTLTNILEEPELKDESDGAKEFVSTEL